MSDAPKIVLQPLGEVGEVCEDDVCVVPTATALPTMRP
jgi:hypothetical protein